MPVAWIPEEMRERNTNLKQGSLDTPISMNEEMINLYRSSIDMSINTYKTLIEANVAPEIARAVLPQSMYTEFIETGSLSAYSRLCKLRTDMSAQKEIRDFANAVCNLIIPIFPITWNALSSNS